MSTHSPTGYADAARTMRSGLTFSLTKGGLSAEHVLVLSHTGLTGTLWAKGHPLTDHVLTGAERYQDDYMSGKGRNPHPSVTVYFLKDDRSGRVAMAAQADGTILDELDTVRPEMSQRIRDELREAFTEGARKVIDWRRSDV